MLLALIYIDTAKQRKDWMPLHQLYRTPRSHDNIEKFWAEVGNEAINSSLLMTGLFAHDTDRLATALETYGRIAQLFGEEQNLNRFSTLPDFAQIYRSGELI